MSDDPTLAAVVTDTDRPALAPHDLDLTSAPRVRRSTTALVVDGETVLLNDEGAAHVLNATGSLLWQFLDGRTTLSDLADDFVVALDADRSAVERDLVEFTQSLGVAGLLEGVALPFDVDALLGDSVPTEPLTAGDLLEPFSLPDLDGEERSTAAWQGRRWLLINWSPGCGYCAEIAPALAAMAEGLSRQGIEVVFLTDGSAEVNRTLFAAAGLTAVALLRDADHEAFRGVGTPAAYLIDADGRVERPLAIGALEVPQLVTELAGAEVPHESDGADPPLGARYLPAPSGVCGPGAGGGGAPDSIAWAGMRAYRIGDVHVGVRFDSVETADVLDQLLAAVRVVDPGVPGNLSVALEHGGDGSARRLNLLVQGGLQLVRSRSPGRVLAALLSYLDTVADEPVARDGYLTVTVTAGVRDGVAVLFPGDLRPWLQELQPRLSRRGIALVDGPLTQVDTATAELVVPAPAIPFDATVLERYEAGAARGEQPRVRSGRYPLSDWCLLSSEPAAGAWSRAQAVAGAYGLVAGAPTSQELAERLTELFERVRGWGVWASSPAALVDQLPPAHHSALAQD